MSTKHLPDPTLADVLRCLGETSGAHIERKSGVASSTIRAWRHGKVRSPQNKTMEFALYAVGFKRVIVRA